MNSVHAPRGHAVIEFTEHSEGDVELHDIIYMSQAVDDLGNSYDDPQAHWEVDHFAVYCEGDGTIQFFAVDADGVATDELTPAITIDDIKTPIEGPANWYVPPQRDVSYTTTGAVNVQVRLLARLFRGGFARSLNVAP